MATYENKPLTLAPNEQLGMADTAVDRELSNLDEEEAFACMDMASTQGPLRKLFCPPDLPHTNPSPVLTGLPSPSVHAYEKGVADVSVDSASYPHAPPPTPHADSDRLAKPGQPALRSNPEKVIAAAALKASQDPRRLAEKVKLVDYTLTAIQMRLENDSRLSRLLPSLSREVAEKALTKFFKSRSEDYRGTLAGHSSVEDALASEVRQLHDSVSRDRLHGAPPNPGCGADLIQRMEDVENESSRERQRELGVVERELVEVDRDVAKDANGMSEISLKLLNDTKERYNQLQRLHLENQRHKQQQLKEQHLKDQRLREQQLRDQQQRVQNLEGQHMRDQQLYAQQIRGQRVGPDDILEQNFKAMKIQERQEWDTQERELVSRTSQSDRISHALEGKHGAPPGALQNVSRVACGESGTGAYPVSTRPAPSDHRADHASNYPTPGTLTAHPISNAASNAPGVLHPGAGMAQPSQRSSADRMSSNGLRQAVPNPMMHQPYSEVGSDRIPLQTRTGGMALGDVPFVGVAEALRLQNGREPLLPLPGRSVPPDYPYSAPYNHRSHIPDIHQAAGADQQYYPLRNSRALAPGQGDLSHQRPPPEYAIGRPHSLSNNSASQMPYDHYNPLLQQSVGPRYGIYPYPAESYLSQQSSDFCSYPLGTYYDEDNVAAAKPGYAEYVPLSALSSQQPIGATGPRFNPQSHLVTPLASNLNEEAHRSYRSTLVNGVDVAGPSRNAIYTPGLGQQPTSMYPGNRELQTWSREGRNYIQSGQQNRASDAHQGPACQTSRSALVTPGCHPVGSRSGLLPG
eukprot:GFKZ01002302.1.p1 GENE.GFKZ01002302.1~~GFKZ01002302.1.p1  ORF type:complete len:803 (+),score=68.66 GFKZ01002302.1:348-2756(+)